MASLVGQQLKDTYDSLLKTSDNDALGGTYKEITDGAGNGSGLYLGTGGRVGIGETNPLVPLHISKDSASGENIALLLDNNDATANNEIGLLFRGSIGGQNTDFQIASINKSANNADLVFRSDGTVERMRIESGGDISFRDTSTNEAFYWDASAGSLGIGTTSPDATLEVSSLATSSGDARYEMLITEDNTASAGRGGGLAFTRQGIVYGGIKTLQNTSSDDNTSMYFQTRGGGTVSNRMIIDESGNVGIGTDSPDATLDLENSSSGNIQRTLILSNPNTAVAGTGTEIYFSCVDGNNRGSFIRSASTTNVNDTYLAFGTNASGSDATERLRILSSGGITFNGDTATANALDDYEEGTWTPTMANASITSSGGSYTKIGNRIDFWGTIVFGSATDANTLLGGLPFDISGGNNRAIGITTNQDALADRQLGLYQRTSNSYSIHNGSTGLSVTDLQNSTIFFSGTYIAG